MDLNRLVCIRANLLCTFEESSGKQMETVAHDEG